MLVAAVASQKKTNSTEIEPLYKRPESSISPDPGYDEDIISYPIKEKQYFQQAKSEKKDLFMGLMSMGVEIRHQECKLNPLVTHDDMVSFVLSLKEEEK